MFVLGHESLSLVTIEPSHIFDPLNFDPYFQHLLRTGGLMAQIYKNIQGVTWHGMLAFARRAA